MGGGDGDSAGCITGDSLQEGGVRRAIGGTFGGAGGSSSESLKLVKSTTSWRMI